MAESIVSANGVALCTEAFGRPEDPSILLIMGAAASMVWWPDGLCERLAAGGRYVIRYDNRDTGRSITYEPGKPGYSLDDLAEDAIAVLSAYGIQRSHVAGMSLGGMIGQIAALNHPDRVASLTLISSSVFGPDDPDLPGIDPKIVEYHRSGESVNWSNEEEVIRYMAEGWRLLSGGAHAFDEEAIYAIAAREAKRATSLTSMFNHALLTGGEQWYGKIGEIGIPTLIIHGTEDPVLPFEHAVALSKTIPGSRLLALDGVGHELHKSDWPAIAGAILSHTGAADSGRAA
jgi:pimeloyl-ACP methyl ester carboxylesterase